MSDPRSPHQNSGLPWESPEPQPGPEPYQEPLGSPAHPQSPYASSPDAEHPARPERAHARQRRRRPGTPLPEPPAGLGVGVVVAAGCLLFVELAELAILLVTGTEREASGFGLGAGFDFNGGIATAVFGLGAYLATCAWLQAGRRFAEAANPRARFARGQAWTWLGWWVPVVFLWFPYQVVRDIRDAVVPDGQRRVSLSLWWPFWLLAGLRFYSLSDGPGELIVRAVAAAALVVAFVHWIRIVREITRAQEKLAGLG